jgi:GPI-anchor transamidase subunit GAA1
MLGGVIWVLLLPLNQYSRQTYISENALLPGQVHTYFGGSEQNVFRGYKQELLSVIQPFNELVSALDAQPVRGKNRTENERRLSEAIDERSNKIEELFQNAGLKTSRQKYAYQSAGEKYWGENVYSVLNAPRGDSTEAIVLVAALKNIEGKDNVNGVTLLITLARYFKRTCLPCPGVEDSQAYLLQDGPSGPKTLFSSSRTTPLLDLRHG